MGILQSAKVVAFIVVRDRVVAAGFYSGVLGFAVVEEDAFAVVLDLNGTMLRISSAAHFQAQPHTVLGWDVPEIVGAVGALRDNGVVFNIYEGFGQDALGIWAAPGGAKVAWFNDPDGNVLSLTQF